jgi:hypothetical protein
MRALTAGALALLARIMAGEQGVLVQLVRIDLEVPQYFSNAGYSITWDSKTWQPVGVTVDAIEDQAGADPGTVLITLPGVTEAQLALVLTEPVEGKAVYIYDAWIEPTTGAVEHAELVRVCTANVPGLEDGDEAVIGIMCEDRSAQAYRTKPARYTNAEQLAMHTGDTGLDYDPATDGGPVVWPAASFFKV